MTRKAKTGRPPGIIVTNDLEATKLLKAIDDSPFTGYEVARKAGVAVDQVSRWRTGICVPNARSLRDMWAALALLQRRHGDHTPAGVAGAPARYIPGRHSRRPVAAQETADD